MGPGPGTVVSPGIRSYVVLVPSRSYLTRASIFVKVHVPVGLSAVPRSRRLREIRAVLWPDLWSSLLTICPSFLLRYGYVGIELGKALSLLPSKQKNHTQHNTYPYNGKGGRQTATTVAILSIEGRTVCPTAIIQ
jgi:hypothetical protein